MKKLVLMLAVAFSMTMFSCGNTAEKAADAAEAAQTTVEETVEAAEAAGVKGYLFTGENLLEFMKTIVN